MCALRQTLLAFGLAAALLAPAAQAQQQLRFGQPPAAMPLRGGAPFGPSQFGRQDFPTPPPPSRNDDRDSPPLSDSVRWAQRQSGGRVIGIDRVQSDGREINRIKVLDGDGRVRYIDDDRQLPRRDGNRDDARRGATQHVPQTP